MNHNIRLGSAETGGFDFRRATWATVHRRGTKIFDRAFARSVICDGLVFAGGASHWDGRSCGSGDCGRCGQLDLALPALDAVSSCGAERHRDDCGQ